ncbi:MAG TPA: 5-dehydro-4-deoxy-D-glucuronate isomerase [Tepidisphaeraceae bacterium]
MGFKLTYSPRRQDVQSMTTEDLRAAFVIGELFGSGPIQWTFTDLDRLAVAGVRPAGALTLENERQTGSEFFLARRELGILNIGGAGVVRADGRTFQVETHDCLYVSMGTREVTFESPDRHAPAKFYCVSTPAHQAFATTLVTKAQVTPVALGSKATANERKIYQYIHEKGIRSSQLVMGFTELAEGSVWNTMPCHTHTRRTEIYMYFDVAPGNIIAHFLGMPQQTRHVFLQSDEVVLSPSWSIHTGVGTGNYRFCWAMGGENQDYNDMDKVEPGDLR